MARVRAPAAGERRGARRSAGLRRRPPAHRPRAPQRHARRRLELHLTRKEFALLALLVRDAGRVVTQPQLLRELWGPEHVEDTHYLRVVVGGSARSSATIPRHPRYLQTEPGVGYRFLGER